MILLFSPSCVVENTSSVVKEIVSDSYNTADWSSLVDFIHDVCFTCDVSILFNSVNFSTFLCPAALSERCTVLTLENRGAPHSIISSIGLIGGAGFVCDVVLMNPCIGGSRITSMASVIGILAGNDNLRTNEHVWPLGFAFDFDSVTKRAGG